MIRDGQQGWYIVSAIERDLERLADQNVIGEDDIREFEHKNSLVALGAAIRQLSKLPVERDVHAFQPQGLQIRADHPAHEQRAVVPTVFRPMNESIEPQRQAIDRRGAFAGLAVRSAVAPLARRRLGMEGGPRLPDPGANLLPQSAVRTPRT